MARKPPTPVILPVPFPLKGKDTNWARNVQPPLTTPDALNVWAYDRHGRARGAQRPGFTRMWAESVSDEVLYYQATSCDTGELAQLWAKASEFASLPAYFKWAGDGLCYSVASTSPKTFAPGVIAFSSTRTTASGCADTICGGGGGANPPTYRQARRCSNGELASLYVPTVEISAYPYYFKFAGDGICYKVLSSEALTTAPTLIAPLASRTAIDDCDDVDCACSGCGTFAWDTGEVAENGFVGGTTQFVRGSPAFEICTNNDFSGIVFSAASDDIVILTKSTDVVTQTYSGVVGATPTITLPADYIIFRDTYGSMRSAAEGSNPATCPKVVTDGTSTSNIPLGTSSSAYDHVVDLEADGFATRLWSAGVTFAEMDALGWIDADGVARLKMWHVVCGRGRAEITSVSCQELGDFEMYSTGEDVSGGEDQVWEVRQPAGSGTWVEPVLTENTIPEGFGGQNVVELFYFEQTSPARWISYPPTAAGTGSAADIEYRHTGILFSNNINTGTFELTLEIGGDDRAVEVYVNDVLEWSGTAAFGGATTVVIDATNFSVGSSNVIRVVTEDVGDASANFQGFYCRVVGVTW